MKRMWLALLSSSSLALSLVACGAPPGDDGAVVAAASELEAVSSTANEGAFQVDFTKCREFAGIGQVPAANARRLVPARYTLAGDATNALIVVRVASCEGAAVDGKKARETKISQIGISLVGPDTTADINNYTVWYVTDSAALAGKLISAGGSAEIDRGLLFDFAGDGSGGGTLRLAATPPQAPSYAAQGPVIIPTAAPTNFVASWWQDGRHGTIRMRTVFPGLRFGGATMTLVTRRGSALARLIGATSLTFPLLDSFNAAAAAQMDVRVVAN